MTSPRLTTFTLLAAAVLAACGTAPTNAMLDQAHADYRDAEARAEVPALAAAELKQASDALNQADAAQSNRANSAEVTQLAYLAKQRVALAQESANRKSAEAAVASASAQRDKMRLASRTQEADTATRQAAVATREATVSQQQAQAAQRQAAASQQQAGDAELRAQALAVQLRELNAKQTDRGMVITIGDVLFDSDRAELKSGGVQNIERLSNFLKQYPARRAAIEGYTDSTGGDSHNQTLSERRANAVMTTLLGMGVNQNQLTAQGYGETHPVAGNDNSAGRQMNRRVEIVLSDESGKLSNR